tara:strand:+ start:5531 stop:6364 length:834 start_codon:yes stop_codon:yes gene_type:complete
MSITDTTLTPDTTTKTPTALGTESSLSSWVGPYVTDMLGKGQGLASEPYQAYTGPLTAGTSDLQDTAFQGLGSLNIPTEKMGAFTPQTFTADKATQYMNPYLSAALQPQIDEAIRQSDIRRLADASRLTKAGAYGGSRQAIMESEGNRNLLQNLSGITGKGYADAYDKGLGQFNIEQNLGRGVQEDINKYGLAALQKQADLGAVQRGIESEGVTADMLQFEQERDYPLKMVQYMQSLLQNLPTATSSTVYEQPSVIGKAMTGAGDTMTLIKNIFGMA